MRAMGISPVKGCITEMTFRRGKKIRCPRRLLFAPVCSSITPPMTAATTQPSSSPWSPFRHSAFAVLWTATVISNIGTWMQSAAAGWLITSLDPQPRTVALVQLATALPMFLLALPAGAIADIVDRRRLLLGAQIVGTVIIAVFSVLVWWNLVTPAALLLFTGA